MLSSDRICGSTRFGKARYLSQLPIQCIAFVTPRFLSPVFTVSARNAWDHALARTHEKKKKKKIDRNIEKKRNAYILRVLQLKPATLTSQFRPSPAGKLILKIKHFSYFILLVNSLLQFFRTFTKSTKEFTAVHCSSAVHFEIQRMQTASFAWGWSLYSGSDWKGLLITYFQREIFQQDVSNKTNEMFNRHALN